jgi:hypothetical protein
LKRLGLRFALVGLLTGCLYCIVPPIPAQSAPAQDQGQTLAQSKPVRGNTKTSQPANSAESEGEIRFRANCGRCHNPPEDLSPREARAVIRQMRVRAMLSAEDERLILKYIAP